MSEQTQHIFEFNGQPDTVPTSIGSHAIDTVNKRAYISVGTDTVDDWAEQPSATPVLTAEAIKTAYESNPDTNVFTDAEKAAVATISSGTVPTDPVATPSVSFKEVFEIEVLSAGVVDVNALDVAGKLVIIKQPDTGGLMMPFEFLDINIQDPFFDTPEILETHQHLEFSIINMTSIDANFQLGNYGNMIVSGIQNNEGAIVSLPINALCNFKLLSYENEYAYQWFAWGDINSFLPE